MSTYLKIIIKSYQGLASRKEKREGKTHKKIHRETQRDIYGRTHERIYRGTNGEIYGERDSRRNTEGYMESL